MCMVSAVGDNFKDQWKARKSILTPDDVWDALGKTRAFNPVERKEFEELKKEIEALKKVLIAAKIYDEETGQKDCDIDEKVDLIKKVANAVGVDLSEVFSK